MPRRWHGSGRVIQPARAALVVLTLYLLGDLCLTWRLSQGAGPCLLDDEGSWSIGLFRGSSPLNLTPIESARPGLQGPTAWPVANPVLTCASVTGPPSNFVADPFLWVQPNGSWFLFFETKTNTNMQGDIGVAESLDGGASWRHLGLALDEPWHLSYPHVFSWRGEVFMAPEGHGSGALRLYRAVQLPLEWEHYAVLLDRPLVDTSLFQWEGRWWMLGSDAKRRGATPSGELEAFYADTPLGHWTPHARNPLMNGDRRAGARMGGRVLPHDGGLLRFGQDCGDTYGHRLVAYRIRKLTPTEFEQSLVPLEFGQSRQGQGAWNGVRHHHLDAHQLPDGSWVAVMDGDYQRSGPISGRLRRAAVVLGTLWGTALGLTCAGRLRRRRRTGAGRPAGEWPAQQPRRVFIWALPLLLVRRIWASLAAPLTVVGGGGAGGRGAGGLLRPRCSTQKPCSLPLGALTARGCAPLGAGGALRRGWRSVCGRLGLAPGGWAAVGAGALALAGLGVAGVAGAVGWYYLSIRWESPTAAAAVAVEGQLSKYTLVTMTYAARLPTLRLFVSHYSKCPSVAEILLVWNSGPPPDPCRDFPGAAVPVRVRREAANSLNNRFRPDPLLRTRAALQLDDDILMWCSDLERGFAAWRRHPGRLVGFHPRQLRAAPPQGPAYEGEWRVFRDGAYNAILTGAAFMDAHHAFPLYWSQEHAAGRAVVDRLFNGEDILMNFVLAAEAARQQAQQAGGGGSEQASTVLYVRPRRRLDISRLSSVGISRDSGAHTAKRLACLAEFGRLFGGSPLRAERISWGAQAAGRPTCGLPGLGCLYL